MSLRVHNFSGKKLFKSSTVVCGAPSGRLFVSGTSSESCEENGARLIFMIRSARKYLHKYFAGHTALLAALLFVSITTITLRGTDISGLVAAATSSITKAPVVLYFTPYDDTTIQVGQTSKIDLNINTRVPINALGVTLKVPQDMIEIVGFSKEKSFLELWTEETAIKEDIGEMHFSGGTTRKGGLLGTSTALTLTVRAKKSGDAKLFFASAEIFPDDGKGMSVENDAQDLTINIPEPAKPVASGGGGAPVRTADQPLPQSADLNDDGTVTLIDISIMIVHIFGPYDPRFDLDTDGGVGISDLSILLSKLGGN